MTPSMIKALIVAEKIAYTREMIETIRRMPLSSYDDFTSDFKNPAASESYLRRSLEALLDLGRHILSKGFAETPAEYKEIATMLVKHSVLTQDEGKIMRQMAGYRNRMVHFYNEISIAELYSICQNDLADIERICDTFVNWIQEHADKVDSSL